MLHRSPTKAQSRGTSAHPTWAGVVLGSPSQLLAAGSAGLNAGQPPIWEGLWWAPIPWTPACLGVVCR